MDKEEPMKPDKPMEKEDMKPDKPMTLINQWKRKT